MKIFLAALFGLFLTLGVLAEEGPQGDSLTIYLQAGGVHSDIVVPLHHQVCDWSVELQHPNKSAKDENWISFGWGSKLFYLNTPEWNKVKPKHFIGAMIGKGGAAYHIRTMKEPATGEHCKAFRISSDDYVALCNFLRSVFSSTTSPRPLIAYKPGFAWDGFYEAKGRYWLLNNCNTFSNKALHRIGLSDRLWVVTYGQLFRALEN